MSKHSPLMTALLAAAIAALPMAAHADGYAGAYGVNRLGERMRFIGEDANMLVVDGESGEPKAHYDLKLHCPAFPGGGPDVGARFTCPAGSEFPLAGATYRVKLSRSYRPCDVAPEHNKTPYPVYVCVAGCSGKRVVRMFFQEPWEC